MHMNNLQFINKHKFIPPFAKGGLGGILNAVVSGCGKNPPQSPFFKGGERSEGALVRGTNHQRIVQRYKE